MTAAGLQPRSVPVNASRLSWATTSHKGRRLLILMLKSSTRHLIYRHWKIACCWHRTIQGWRLHETRSISAETLKSKFIQQGFIQLRNLDAFVPRDFPTFPIRLELLGESLPKSVSRFCRLCGSVLFAKCSSDLRQFIIIQKAEVRHFTRFVCHDGWTEPNLLQRGECCRNES